MSLAIHQIKFTITAHTKSCSCLADSRDGSTPTERFLRSNRPGYSHPVSSELENSGIRVAVGDCSVTERRRWRPPYQIGKTVHVHAKHYKHNEDGRTAPGVCGNGSVPLSHLGNVVTRTGIHTPCFNSALEHFHCAFQEKSLRLQWDLSNISLFEISCKIDQISGGGTCTL